MLIPIENIYYLLCYAWNKLDEEDRVSVEITDKTELLDLFAKVLIQGTRILLKQGIDKNYKEFKINLPGVKGKLEFSETVKSGQYANLRTICTIDEFSGNTLPNQLLVSTLLNLIQTKELNNELKSEIKPLLWMFPPVQRIKITNHNFKQIRLHRNNQFYGFLLNVCQIIHQNSLPTEKQGEWTFADFRKDERKMATLFESFLFNFYKRELHGWKVIREQIQWQMISRDQSDAQYLPQMITDISLENPSASEKIIIDAKYYRETMKFHFESEKIQSGNLYQLISYLINQETKNLQSQHTRGILIYPTIKKEYDLFYQFRSHPVQIRTVNLDMPWRQIHARLKEIVLNK